MSPWEYQMEESERTRETVKDIGRASSGRLAILMALPLSNDTLHSFPHLFVACLLH